MRKGLLFCVFAILLSCYGHTLYAQRSQAFNPHYNRFSFALNVGPGFGRGLQPGIGVLADVRYTWFSHHTFSLQTGYLTSTTRGNEARYRTTYTGTTSILPILVGYAFGSAPERGRPSGFQAEAGVGIGPAFVTRTFRFGPPPDPLAPVLKDTTTSFKIHLLLGAHVTLRYYLNDRWAAEARLAYYYSNTPIDYVSFTPLLLGLAYTLQPRKPDPFRPAYDQKAWQQKHPENDATPNKRKPVSRKAMPRESNKKKS